MQVAVEPFNFLLLPANIQYFSVLISGQLSKGCRFDALRDLCDTRLALLCLICKVPDVSSQTWLVIDNPYIPKLTRKVVEWNWSDECE